MDQGLRIVKMFELELSARKTAIQLEHSIHPHAADACEIMTSGKVEFDESNLGGKRKGNRKRTVAAEMLGKFRFSEF